MKIFKLILIFTLFAGFLLSITSCLVVHDTGGGKKGWYKNSNNPHHPNSTNPGNGKGRGHGKK
ncbi:MAG: hypothetical protein V4608_11180 [Bacteroidota bacterium]